MLLKRHAAASTLDGDGNMWVIGGREEVLNKEVN